MKLKIEKTLNRRLTGAVIITAICCAIVVLLDPVAWLGAAACAVFGLLMLLTGSGVTVAQGILWLAYIVADCLLSEKGGFPWGPILFGVGMIGARIWLKSEFRRVEKIEDELAVERRRRDGASLISSVGQARNLRAYQNDAAIYLKLTRRYHLNLCMMLWKLENAELLRVHMGEASFENLMREVSATINRSVRTEDMVYLIHEDIQAPYWGTLHIMNDENACGIIEQRVAKAIEKIPLSKGDFLDFKVAHEVAQEQMTPMSLLETVTKRLEP